MRSLNESANWNALLPRKPSQARFTSSPQPPTPPSTYAIAFELNVGESTIKGHVSNIMSKLGATDRTGAVTLGLRRGLITLTPKSRLQATTTLRCITEP